MIVSVNQYKKGRFKTNSNIFDKKYGIFLSGSDIMKNLFLKKSLIIIHNKYHYNETKMLEIKYGLESLYLVLSKMLFISVLAFILGIFQNYFLFLLFYIPIRSFSYGWHANTSKTCWIVSTISLLFIPFIATYLKFNLLIKLVIISVSLIIFLIYAPADTKKKPLINSKKRLLLKISSILVILIYSTIILLFNIPEKFSTLMLLALLYQTTMITPVIYILSKQSFNNYKEFCSI